MKTLAILSPTGGAGTTTLAVHVAVLAQRSGHQAVLVDADPRRAATRWWHVRGVDTPALLEADSGQIPGAIEVAKKDGADLVIVDTASRATAAAGVDFALIPCRPGDVDLRALGEMAKMLERAGVRAAIVLNACPPARAGESAITLKARQALTAYEKSAPLAPVSVAQHLSLVRALVGGYSVTERERDGVAAAEMQALWDWLDRKL
jgi:chromosome partitioning protein